MFNLDNVTISLATSTSLILDSAAVKFSVLVVKLFAVYSNLFCIAPNSDLAAFIDSNAASTFVTKLCASVELETLIVDKPFAILDKSAVVIVLVSELAPACIVNDVLALFNNCFPLNLVSSDIFFISSCNCSNSFFTLSLSLVSNVSLPACTPNSLIL